MSLSIYLDDCANDRRLVRLLRAAGHAVTIPADVGLTGADDPDHFRHAAANGLVVLTKNPLDFERLHQAHPVHAGVFAVYQDNRPGDMTPTDITRAVGNIEAAGVPIAGQFVVLNAWRY